MKMGRKLDGLIFIVEPDAVTILPVAVACKIDTDGRILR
jgi:hypothetical protein